MSELSLRFLSTRREVQLHAVSVLVIWYRVITSLSSPRFELPVSNQSATANLPSHSSIIMKSAQPRRPLEQVTCFKVVVYYYTKCLFTICLFSVERKVIMPTW